MIQTFILSPSSIVQLIHNSPDLRGIYGLINRDDIEVNTVQNLGSSKDRFDSTSKPLSRFCATFDSVWKAAVAIQDRRKGTVPGQRASEFLRYVSAESLMQAAMLADAAMEAMAVVRFHDTESFDLSLVPQVICQFLHRTDVELQDDKHGFSSHASKTTRWELIKFGQLPTKIPTVSQELRQRGLRAA